MITGILQDKFALSILCLAVVLIVTGTLLVIANKGSSLIATILSIVIIVNGIIIIALFVITWKPAVPANNFISKIESSSGMRVLGWLSPEQCDRISSGNKLTDVLLVDDSDGTVYNCKVENKNGEISSYFEVKHGKYIKIDQLFQKHTGE